MTIEGSSESSWQQSDNFRINSSGDASHDSGDIRGRKERDRVVVEPVVHAMDWSDVSLRQWLDNPERSVDAIECLHIFMQIVEIVDLSHSLGIVVHNVRPSCFVMSSFNHVSFIESSSCSDSGSESLDYGSSSQTAKFKGSSSPLPSDSHQQRSHSGTENSQLEIIPTNASNIISEISCLQSSSINPIPNSLEVGDNVEQMEEKKPFFPMKQVLLREMNWYTSPEEVGGAPSSCASDIYRLGVLLFELFCPFTSAEEKCSTMSTMRHRLLPPQLLLKWPKEALFCLGLLHPEPSSRPKMSELLQSEFLNKPRDNIKEREAAIELQERIEEQELLLEFLLLMQQRKQEAADNLQETISFLSSDTEEVIKQQSKHWRKGGLCPDLGKDSVSNLSMIKKVGNEDSGCSGSRKRYKPGLHSHNVEESGDHLLEGETAGNEVSILSKSPRLMKNFKKWESAYFLTRHRANSSVSLVGRGSIIATERNSVKNLPLKDHYNEARQSGWINLFLEGLCKYLSFTKLQVKADLKQGDLLNSSKLVCSVSFDRDGEFFATAGVNKKIKVFEYHTVANDRQDIHYPVVELTSISKLSSICWNSYIKSQIASSNFGGMVQVWDVTRNQVYMEMREHEKHVWSVDFSFADPTLLASGSDDGSVKLWNTNQAILFLHLVE
ncbi:RING-type E3 ubiquitin transferase [Sarracenia purpurea var. burkii]